MNWGKIAKAMGRWWLVCVTIAGGGGLAFIPIALTANPVWWLWLLLGVSVLAAGGAPILDRKRMTRKEQKALAAAGTAWIKARKELTVVITATIPPNLAGIIRALEYKAGYSENLPDLITSILHHCRFFLSEDRGVEIRANYYRMEGEGRRAKLIRQDMTDGDSRLEFTQGVRDLEGQYLVRAIQSRQTIFCPNVEDPQEQTRLQLDPQKARSYVSFLSVPVVSGAHVLGMLSVNVASLNVLEEDHGGKMLRLMAGFIAVAETLKKIPAAAGMQETESV